MPDLKVALQELKEESIPGRWPRAAVPQLARRRGVIWVVGLLALFCALGGCHMVLARSTNKARLKLL